VLSGRRGAARNGLGLEAILRRRKRVFHPALVANISKDEPARTVRHLLHSLLWRNSLIDRTIHFKSYPGISERRPIFSGYHAPDVKNVIVDPLNCAA